jgi:hypothetical protein
MVGPKARDELYEYVQQLSVKRRKVSRPSEGNVANSIGADIAAVSITTRAQSVEGARVEIENTRHVTARVVQKFKPVKEIFVAEKLKFGQLNSVFRLNLPSDPVLMGLAFGNVTSRDTIYCKNRWHHYIAGSGEEGVGSSKEVIVCLHDVDSTALRLSVINNAGRPFKSPDSRDSEDVYSGVKQYLYARKRERIDKIYLVEVHPERVNFNYDSIISDNHNTKVFEKI